MYMLDKPVHTYFEYEMCVFTIESFRNLCSKHDSITVLLLTKITTNNVWAIEQYIKAGGISRYIILRKTFGPLKYYLEWRRQAFTAPPKDKHVIFKRPEKYLI